MLVVCDLTSLRLRMISWLIMLDSNTKSAISLFESKGGKSVQKSIFFGLIILFLLAGTADSYAASDHTYIINGQISDNGNFSEDDDLKVIEAREGGYNRLFDYAAGYTLDYPGHMWVDVSLSAVRVVIAETDSQIEIYYDDFRNTVHSSSSYMAYSKSFLRNREDHMLEMEKTINVDGLNCHLLKWQRDKVRGIPGDKNHYLCAQIVKSPYEVYTILIKSSSSPDDLMPLIKSFRLIEKKGKPAIHRRFFKPERDLNKETAAFYDNYFTDKLPLKWGIYDPWSFSWPDNFAGLEKKLDYHFDFLVWYQNIDMEFPLDVLENAYQDNRYVELTLQTMSFEEEKNQGISYEILKGSYDDFLHDYARQLKEFGHPVLFRLNNEMNGDWCSYSSFYSSRDAEIFKGVWRYIYNIFRENGVDNVLWVWNPHDLSFPGFKWNHYLNYYPGDEYVDIVGLTGYNTGTYHQGELWRDFASIYYPLYDEYCALFTHPLMITEFACSSVGGDKIEWLEDMFVQIADLDRLRVAIWFNGIDLDSYGNPARIYRMDENEAMIETFAAGLQDTMGENEERAEAVSD